jgi:MFS family permease
MAPSGIASALIILLTLRFALGMGVASIYPAANRLVASWIPSAERGLASGWIFAGVGVGAGVALNCPAQHALIVPRLVLTGRVEVDDAEVGRPRDHGRVGRGHAPE